MEIGRLAATAAVGGPVDLAEIKPPEGAEFPMRLQESLSSRTAQIGDRFALTLEDDVSDGTVLKSR